MSAIDYTAAWDDDAVETLVEQYQELGELYKTALDNRGYSHMEPFNSALANSTRSGDYKNCCPEFAISRSDQTGHSMAASSTSIADSCRWGMCQTGSTRSR